MLTKTRGRAWETGGQVLVQVEGKAGAVAMEAISIDPKLEAYCRLGRSVESHPLDCLCRACQAFIAAGLELRDARAAEAA